MLVDMTKIEVKRLSLTQKFNRRNADLALYPLFCKTDVRLHFSFLPSFFVLIYSVNVNCFPAKVPYALPETSPRL